MSKKKIIILIVVAVIAVFGLIIIIDAIKITMDVKKGFNNMKATCEGLLNKNASIDPGMKKLCVDFYMNRSR